MKITYGVATFILITNQLAARHLKIKIISERMQVLNQLGSAIHISDHLVQNIIGVGVFHYDIR